MVPYPSWLSAGDNSWQLTPWVSTFIGTPAAVLGRAGEQARASIPLLNGLMPKFRFPEASLVYFQFVFAAITPILFIGSVIGRIRFKVWLLFVPLWITFAYAVNAFLHLGRRLLGRQGRPGLQAAAT